MMTIIALSYAGGIVMGITISTIADYYNSK